ncbi:MAG TPA: HlyD family efflux transporter periplasmic adaptor subunit [Thermoguttaceae bacterium]
MANTKRIPIPWSHRWRRLRYNFIPGAFFVLSLCLTVWLWQRERMVPNAIGEVEAVRLDVAALADGTLVPLSRGHWSLFETVVDHDVIARLDDSIVKAQLDVFQKELARLSSELQAVAAKEKATDFDRRQTHQRELARLTLQLESNRLNVLDRQVQIEFDQIDLKRRQFRLEYLQSLHKNNVVTELDYQDEKMLRDQVERRLNDNVKALEEAKKQQQEAQERLESLPDYQKLELETLLDPIVRAIDAQQARIKELQLQIDNLEIRAPITGTICAIHRWPGQTVRAGDPIMTIAADTGRYIVSYIRQENIIRPQPGADVLIKVREPKAVTVASKVEQVGSQMEMVPLHQLRNVQLPEWGVPVRISIPNNLVVKPGELVDVSFKP